MEVKNMTFIRKKGKRVLALLTSVVMCLVSLFASVPLTAQAAGTRIYNYWPSDGYAYKCVKISGDYDAYCIDFGNAASDYFFYTKESGDFYDNLSHSQKIALDKIFTYAYQQKYLNYPEVSRESTFFHYYAGIQRAVWKITDRKSVV